MKWENGNYVNKWKNSKVFCFLFWIKLNPKAMNLSQWLRSNTPQSGSLILEYFWLSEKIDKFMENTQNVSMINEKVSV